MGEVRYSGLLGMDDVSGHHGKVEVLSPPLER